MRLLKACIGMLLGVTVLIFVVLFVMPTERIAMIAAQQFEAETGRSLTFDGKLTPSFYPVVGATAHGVVISGPDGAGGEPLLRAAEVDIGVSLSALLRGTIVLDRILLQDPHLHLIRDAAGRVNWDRRVEPANPAAPISPRQPRAVSITEARISGGTLLLEDMQSGTTHRIEGLEATMRLQGAGAQAEMEVEGRLNGQPVRFQARSEAADRLLSGDATPIALEGSFAAAPISFVGQVGLTDLVLDGRLDIEIPDPAAFAALAGQQTIKISSGFLPLALSGHVERSAEGTLSARDAQFRAGTARLAGEMRLAPGPERPRISGRLTGDVLDLRTASRGAQAAQSPAPPTSGWSLTPIDARALGVVDADLSLALNGLRTDIATIGRTQLAIGIDRARAVVEFREATVFGGLLDGEFVMNNRSGLSVGGTLRLREIDLLPLLTELADYRRLQGLADIDLQFLGVGNTVHALMNSLRGEGRLALAQGEIIGFDLAGMLRNMDMSYMGEGNRTIFQSLTGTYTISGGILRNEDLRLDATRLSATGRGRIGLGTRTLDYRIIPAAQRAEDTLRVPLMITGPWEAPRFRLDMEALAREQLQLDQERLQEIARAEAQRLEQRAQSEVARRLQQDLGLEQQEGERIQDTLRRGLEREIGTRLRGLLGGD